MITNKFNLGDKVYFYYAPMLCNGVDKVELRYADSVYSTINHRGDTISDEDKEPFTIGEVCYHRNISKDGIHEFYTYTLINNLLQPYEDVYHEFDINEKHIFTSYTEMKEYINNKY